MMLCCSSAVVCARRREGCVMSLFDEGDDLLADGDDCRSIVKASKSIP